VERRLATQHDGKLTCTPEVERIGKMLEQGGASATILASPSELFNSPIDSVS
jgi:hypothetical protein